MTDTTPQAVEVNCSTGEVTTRELTADEISASAAAAVAAEAERVAAEKAAANALATATAKIEKLGLTVEDLKALL